MFDQVNDINAAVADVKSKNIRCLSEEPRIGQSFRWKLLDFTTFENCYFYRSSWKACDVLASKRLQWGSGGAGTGVTFQKLVWESV